MKKLYAIPGFLAVLSVILCNDAISFLQKVDWSPNASTNAGTALYLFSGIIEVNDRIPYSATPEYFIGLSVVVTICIAITVVAFIKVHLVVKHR